MADDSPSEISSTSVTQTENPNTNPDPYSNPLFLHAADTSSITLVAEKLTGEMNYTLWSRSITKSLLAKNKLGFVLGTIPKPETTHRDFGAWSRCNAIICTWLSNSVSPEIGSLIMYLDEADIIWQTLETRYKQTNVSKIFHVEQKLETLQQGSMELNTFFTKLNALWEELKSYEPYPVCTCRGCTCQANKKLLELLDRRNVVKFLMKLNESYQPARRQILMVDPLPSLSKVYNMIAQEEHQRHASSPSPNSVVFQTTVVSSARPRSPFSSTNKSRPVCAHCGMQGHTIQRCYKIHGYPPSSRSSASDTTMVSNYKPPLLPKPRFGVGSKFQSSVNMITSDKEKQSTDVSSPASTTTTLAQAQALFEKFQSQLKTLGSSSTNSDLVTKPSSQPSPGPYAGLDDWEW
ncbi:PREDICTED: uncharacterized protein LOC104808363 [Tarenaya hassleriana]|uniref:uncharacterized protein LOC104808363 n=1 Tax=Tarenaya hassleriana TaxID=28532 RepID=UPI00053C37CC|nr:PREDICTED: uncharacterized protein LOC104808363 [Tarenaya hassleriana]